MNNLENKRKYTFETIITICKQYEIEANSEDEAHDNLVKTYNDIAHNHIEPSYFEVIDESLFELVKVEK